MMALYKYPQFIAKSEHKAFDREYGPGQKVTHSGIYRCQGCNREIAVNEQQGDPFPPQNHHQHSTQQGQIRWRMVVFAVW